MAIKMGAGSAEPLAHVVPSEQAIPARSKATSNASPSRSGNAIVEVFGNRRDDAPRITISLNRVFNPISKCD